jgi:predicted murein hydrolase (TIGR00659 family)
MNMETSYFFGTALTLAAYWVADVIYKRAKIALLHPVFISAALILAFLGVTGIPVSEYQESNVYIMYLLTPATICLAVPIYKQFELLKKHKWLITFSVAIGVLSSLFVIGGLAALFSFEPMILKSIIAKSITTGVALGLTEQLGGSLSLVTMSVIITGMFGSMIVEQILRVFKITEPIARGLAAGVSSHAMGTIKALEMGRIEGAISSVSMVVTAVMTVVLAPIVLKIFL